MQSCPMMLYLIMCRIAVLFEVADQALPGTLLLMTLRDDTLVQAQLGGHIQQL